MTATAKAVAPHDRDRPRFPSGGRTGTRRGPGRASARPGDGNGSGRSPRAGDPSVIRCGPAQDAGGNSAAGTDGQPVRTLSTIGLAACSTAPTEAAILPRLVDRLS